jgi:hypothetical protein
MHPHADPISQPASAQRSQIGVTASDSETNRGESQPRNDRNRMHSQRARNSVKSVHSRHTNSIEHQGGVRFQYYHLASANLSGFECL